MNHSNSNYNRAKEVKIEEKCDLSLGFLPGENDVILGRGKIAFNHAGNVNFRSCIHKNLPVYQAGKKNEKTDLVNSIAQSVLDKDGKFVRFDSKSGNWFNVGKHAAREKVGHAFRDTIAAQTKTSTKSKDLKRKDQVTTKKHQKTKTRTKPKDLKRKDQAMTKKHQKTTKKLIKVKTEPIPWDTVLQSRKEDYPKELFSVDLLEILLGPAGEDDIIRWNDPYQDAPLVGDWHEDLLSLSNHEFICEMPRSA